MLQPVLRMHGVLLEVLNSDVAVLAVDQLDKLPHVDRLGLVQFAAEAEECECEALGPVGLPGDDVIDAFVVVIMENADDLNGLQGGLVAEPQCFRGLLDEVHHLLLQMHHFNIILS